MAIRKGSVPVSRRERPAKPALTRQGIIDTALKILRAEGLSRVTMRRIATALDTGAASLYVYVGDTEDLHAQILDALLASVSRTRRPKGDWRERLKGLLHRYMDVLFAHPELARMAISTPANGPNYLHLVDSILDLLAQGEVPDRTAAWAVDLLLLYATANAAEHGAWKGSIRAADNIATLKTTIVNADPKKYPHVARLSVELMSGANGRLDWNLDLLIVGLTGMPRPPSGSGAP